MPRAPAALLVVLLAASGCGGGGEPTPRGDATTAPRTEPRAAPPPAGPDQDPSPAPAPPALPRGVPSGPDGPAPAGAEPVIRAWLAAVRGARFERAAALFAEGARVQNGGPVLRLTTRRAAVAWNQALPCGARLTALRGNDGYAIAEFELVDRTGSQCGSGRGAKAYGAIRVRGGRITDWFRLPDPVAPPVGEAPDAPFV